MLLTVVTTVVGLTSTSGRPAMAETISDDDAQAIARDAYIYLYPLVTMNVTRRGTTNVEPGNKSLSGPMNAFTHAREYATADFRDVVRPAAGSI